jgi:hypothetical protein
MGSWEMASRPPRERGAACRGGGPGPAAGGSPGASVRAVAAGRRRSRAMPDRRRATRRPPRSAGRWLLGRRVLPGARASHRSDAADDHRRGARSPGARRYRPPRSGSLPPPTARADDAGAGAAAWGGEALNRPACPQGARFGRVDRSAGPHRSGARTLLRPPRPGSGEAPQPPCRRWQAHRRAVERHRACARRQGGLRGKAGTSRGI